MSSNEYITSADITGTIWQDFDKSTYVEITNNHIEYLSLSLNVTIANLSATDPISSLLKEYGVVYCQRQMALDKIGANNNEIQDNDKYVILFDINNREVERLRKYITPEILTNVADTGSEMTPSCVIYRG